MKTCKCGKEIRDDQQICHECFMRINNLRPIARDEIVLDCDDREHGDMALRQLGQMFSIESYNLEIWRVEGGKSYHIHIKNIPHIDLLNKEQNKAYKESIIRKYKAKVQEVLGYEPEGFAKIDFTLCVPDHPVAAENLPHFKYRTEKKLIAVVNQGCKNFCEVEIYNQIQELPIYNSIIQGSGITARITQAISIIDIARQFGLELQGNKCLCPFHPDNLTPSLVFYEQQGRFCCFGCQAKGNIIKFYAMLKELNPNFKYQKQVKI